MTQKLKYLGNQIQVYDEETDELIAFTKLEGDGLKVQQPGLRGFVVKSREMAVELIARLRDMLADE